MFQRCLSGINAIKFRKGKEIQSLSEIHEISDSAALKEKFYELAEQLLRFIGSGGTNHSSYLVIQLDDTDFQVRKGYEILEDIRKYLTVPNIIILMATDMDMLRVTLTQHYIHEFQQGLSQEIITVDQLRKIESKYLDKLIPPTYTVYLPHLDEMIHQQGESLTIKYIDPDRPEESILLDPQISNDKSEDYYFQSLLLRFVYRKTRIVFAAPALYVHNLIPTTLRGFAQFLGTLSSMQDVPEILESKGQKPKMDELTNPRELAGLINNQLKILEINLPLFENYFLNDWVHTKLSVQKAAVLEKLIAANPEERYQLVITQLKDLYDKKNAARPEETDEKGAAAPLGGERTASYGEMIEYIQKLRSSHRQMDDFYFFFAIHTFFTIQYHKEILRQKRTAIAPYLDGKKGGVLLFDFSPESTRLPDQYYLPSDVYTVRGQQLAVIFNEQQYKWLKGRIKNEKVLRCLVTEVGHNQYQFSVMNFATLFLSMSALKSLGLDQDKANQKNLYSIQTSAATAAINWDVQDILQKSLRRLANKGTPERYFTTLQNALMEIDLDVEAINSKKDSTAPMVYNWLQNMHAFLTDTGSQLHNIFDAIEEALSRTRLNELRHIYAAAVQLQNAIQENPAHDNKLILKWVAFVDTTRNYQDVKQIKGFNLEALHIEELINDLNENEDSPAKTLFWQEFRKQLGNVCRYYGYRIADVKKKPENEVNR